MLTVILAGGESRRMGRDKARLPWGGGTMATELAAAFSAVGDVAFSVRENTRSELEGYIQLADAYPGSGPLNALISAFTLTRAEAVFLVAVDMPFADPMAAQYIFEKLDGHDACVPVDGRGRMEPLFAAYGRACLPGAVDCATRGSGSFRELLEGLDVLRLSMDSLPFSDAARSVINLNTPEEYGRWHINR